MENNTTTNEKHQFELTDDAKQLENETIQIGTIPEATLVYGKPFPLVLVPRNDAKVNFVQL